mmetsp:Transcript_2038/g.7380  ORF Transcript_2038/g.7380 Transcript_2038/m.7380 type:complete len:288 (-) Transcript_2038:35-898(-)
MVVHGLVRRSRLVLVQEFDGLPGGAVLRRAAAVVGPLVGEALDLLLSVLPPGVSVVEHVHVVAADDEVGLDVGERLWRALLRRTRNLPDEFSQLLAAVRDHCDDGGSVGVNALELLPRARSSGCVVLRRTCQGFHDLLHTAACIPALQIQTLPTMDLLRPVLGPVVSRFARELAEAARRELLSKSAAIMTVDGGRLGTAALSRNTLGVRAVRGVPWCGTFERVSCTLGRNVLAENIVPSWSIRTITLAAARTTARRRHRAHRPPTHRGGLLRWRTAVQRRRNRPHYT